MGDGRRLSLVVAAVVFLSSCCMRTTAVRGVKERHVAGFRRRKSAGGATVQFVFFCLSTAFSSRQVVTTSLSFIDMAATCYQSNH